MTDHNLSVGQKPKIVCFDIETSNLDGDYGYILCAAIKPLGEPAKVLRISDYELHKTQPWNDRLLVRDIKQELERADVWVSYYGKRFDQPMINARLLASGAKPLSEVIPHIDLYYVARRVLRISSKRLGNVAELLKIQPKMPVPRAIWVRAQAGHAPSIAYLSRRCRRDVETLEQAYLKLRSNVRLHPHIGVTPEANLCRYCGEPRLQRRGYAITRGQRKRRVQCQACGSWDLRNLEERSR